MPAGRYNILVEQGSTLDFEIIYSDSKGNPIDLTGYSGRMQIRPDFADFTNVVYLTVSSSLDVDGTGLIITPSSGSIRIYVDAVKTDAFTFGEAKYDLELYKQSVVSRIIEGNVQVKKSVTR
jgi:hypothetical protein